MQARDDGHPLPYRDTSKAAAFKISEREHAIQNAEQGAIYGDHVAQARAQIAGRIITGICANVSVTRTGPRKFLHRFNIETAQANLHVRSGDELALLRDPRLRCIVEAVNRAGTTTRVSFLVTAGMQAVGVPPNGAAIDLGPTPPNWFWLGKMRGKMAARLVATPWTHAQAVPPAQGAPATPRPVSLLAAVENLR